MRPSNVRRLCAVMWALPVMLCTACAAPQTVPVLSCPVIPQPPPLALQPPPLTYSRSAQTDIEAWQRALTSTLATP